MVNFELPPSIMPLFLAAGWYPGRDRGPSPMPIDHPAGDVLRQFGKLTVGTRGAGESCARSVLVFGASNDADEQIEVLADALDLPLLGIADDALGYENFYMDCLGRVFCTNIVASGVYLAGSSFGAAMEALLLGRATAMRAVLLEGQDSVPFFGEDLEPGDPRLLTLEQLRKG